jgi:xylan 1,4-beta-xylosidase
MNKLLLIAIALFFQFKTARTEPITGIYLADPTIFVEKGIYYLYGTSSEKGFLVYQSNDLKTWKGPVGNVDGYALVKGQSFGSKGFWAPQVFKYNGTFYMAYTADEHLAIATSDSPLGPFKQPKLKSLSGDTKQIDPFVFFDPTGKAYLYYVKLKEGNRIYVSELERDLSDLKAGTEKECIFGTETWENTEKTNWPVTEGPTVIKKGSLYYLIYSANDFRNKDYAVGYATSASPLGPWKKNSSNPFLNRSGLSLNGTGHGDLFIDKQGNYRYVLHTHFSSTVVSPRRTGIINIQFLKSKNQKDQYSIVANDSSFNFLTLEK